MPDTNAPFDATAALSEVHALRAAAKRRRTWGTSRLTPHRAELVQLRQAGGSFADLQLWLSTKKRIKVEESTVRRYMQKLPELANG